MSRFKKINTSIKDVFAVESQQIGDNRGFLSRLFCTKEMESMGWFGSLQQINFTKTFKKGTVRGFHFQNPPYAEYKYVKCIRGEVYDVALDLRMGSDTFLQTHSEILSESNNTSLIIPPGVAHGFQALTDNVELIYFHSQPYQPEYDDGVNPQEPMISAHWPLEISNMSKKDANKNFLPNKFKGVKIELSPLQ